MRTFEKKAQTRFTMPPQDTSPPTKTTTSSSSSLSRSLTPDESENAISQLSTLITYPTISATAPQDGSYTACANYLTTILTSVPSLSVHTLPESPPNSPVIVARWTGRDPSLPIILLNSHYDVVPAGDDDEWMVPAFEGRTTADGFIYGRGVQDMKSVCIQYIAAIRKLDRMGWTPLRTIYLTFVPDEECGGAGMAAFLESEEFKVAIGGVEGVALALDEGLASEDDTYSVFYGERLPWWFTVTATGPTGHGSRFIPDTAVEQIISLSQKALAFRQNQRDILFQLEPHGADESNCAHAVVAKRTRRAISDKTKPHLGDVTSLNITGLEAGVKAGGQFVMNCVPPVAKCYMDVRISPHVDPKEMTDMVDMWCRECAAQPSSLTWDYVEGAGNGGLTHALTSIDERVNPWYGCFQKAMDRMGLTFRPEVFPAATDSRFLRLLGIRALGFSPMKNSEILLHENNERLALDVFLEGVQVYVGLIEFLGDVGKEIDDMARAAENI